MRIVFMGTPDYSVRTLKKIIDAGHEVAGVFAQPDKPVGRKHILTAPPVKVYAEEKNIPVFQPNTLRDGSALSIIKDLNPDIIVVVAYGKILPKEILDFPKFGCINGHASLLPKYRGASPIQWCICCGEKETGVTVMQMDEGMDTGDIIDVAKTKIGETETAEELFSRLSVISADLTVKVLDDIKNGVAKRIKQDETKVTVAPVINKEMAHLDFSEDAETLYNKVRGFYSWPCAYTLIDGKRLKILSARVVSGKPSVSGTVIENEGKLVISCKGNTALELLTVQAEGSKPMTAQNLLNGKKIPLGTKVL
ncbi:MAG: methionyl-tRNA formyltransferase [Clostridia bacterium]|nr:methionyl-tRNA formyltransferase [Clostridia bacterium]